MEDFSTILWIVIIIGAMVLNTARKVRGSARKQPSQHGEAWPSIPEEGSRDTGEKHVEMSRNTAEPLSTTPPTSIRPESTRQAKTVLDTSARSSRDSVPAKSQYREFPEEGQSLEEIAPEWLDEPERALLSDFNDEDNLTVEEVRQPAKTGCKVSKAESKEENSGRRRQSANKTNAESTAAELVEEFDLRRAVIYSEILKPKFEEYRGKGKEDRPKVNRKGQTEGKLCRRSNRQ